ncbi:hypothetical protein [Giesbergeria sinuosa]
MKGNDYRLVVAAAKLKEFHD